MFIHQVCDLTEKYKRGGRVVVGHMAKLSTMPPERLTEVARRLADVGVAGTVLPATTMMAFPRLLREGDSQALHDRLRRLETSIVPGRFFDHPRHFRLGFAVRPADVAEGLRRLAAALRDAPPG